jgi:hypothetical protein
MRWKKDISVTLVLLSLLSVLASPASAQSTNVTSTTSVNPLALANVSAFSVTPAFTSQNQFIDFSVPVKNIGNLPINASAAINITNSSNSTISNLTFSNISILVGDDGLFIQSWNTNNYPLGDYRGVVVVYYDGKSTSPVEAPFKIQTVTPPIIRRSGSSGPPPTNITPPEELLPELPPIIPPEEQPLGEARIRFVKYPVLKEMRPGGVATADILISNIGDVNISRLSVDIEDMPKEWVVVKTEDMELNAGGLEGINLGLSVPSGAWPGNYRVTVVLKSNDSIAKTFFILRVKPYPVELERPSVTRSVVVDTENSLSIASLHIENSGRFIQRLEIIEEIPKAIASNVNQVDFEVPPSDIIKSDPVVRWTFEYLDFYETRTITYKVPKTLEEYATYVNWPVRQINILYEISSAREMVEIVKVEAPTLSPGKSGNFSLTISNNADIPLDISFTLGLPSGWKTEPEVITQRFTPSSQGVLNFTITPPESTTVGIYTATLKLSYNDKVVTKDVSLFVNEPLEKEFPLAKWILGALIVIAILLVIILISIVTRGKRT